MKITSIPQIYRNVNRWTEIISVLSKYGLADWIHRLNLEFAKGLLTNNRGEALAQHTRETRIRMALTELGPIFIKLGQLLSTRPDLVGLKLAEELKSLRAQVPPDPPEVVRATVEAELGQPIDDLFLEFDDVPLAAASIGQVHAARLKNGDKVVVKVRRQGIFEKVREDMEILAGAAQLAEHIPEFAAYRPVATAAEFQRMLRRELDFGREERNLQIFANEFTDNPSVRIPRPIGELCTPLVLTMERLDGVKLEETDRLAAGGFNLEEIARYGAELYMHMIFVKGVFHADPHPGNILILPGNVIGLLDFGMVGRIDVRLRVDIEELLLAISNRDADHVGSIIIRVGDCPTDLDESALRTDVAEFISNYGSQAVDQFDLSGALNEVVEMIRRFKITLPAQVGLLIKVLVTLEGTAKLLSPQFSLMEVIQPMHRQILMRRLSPARHLRKLRRFLLEMEQLAEVLPRRVMDIMEQVQAGKFDVHLDHRGLGPSVNRLVLGMLASALFVGSSLMLSYSVPPVLFPQPSYFGLYRLSILGMLGCAVSVLLGLRLLRAIGKSGHLDRSD
jgi:ubiquinone biosynthesis protein